MRDQFFPHTECCLRLSSATNSTISLRSAVALSAIRTLKPIAESRSLLPRRGALGRLQHLSSRVPKPFPVRLHPARRSLRTIQQQATLCRARSNARLPFLFSGGCSFHHRL